MKIIKLTAILIASIWLTTFISGFVSGKWEWALMITELVVICVIAPIICFEIIDNY